MHALDRPLLLGLLALERQFVTADELVEAFRIWRAEPADALGNILAFRAKLSADQVRLLDDLVADSSPLPNPNAANDLDASPTTTWRPEATSIAGGVNPTKSPDAPVAELAAEDLNRGGVSARFKPIHLHARGGLGHVFLAEDLELHRQVALKEIRWDAADEPESRERFLSEAKITGNLEHPGIVPVYGLGLHADGRPFYAMRFIQGETLADAIKKLHRKDKGKFTSLEFRQLLSRLVSVCNAVAFAHSRGIVHRDLKPQNIMLGPFGETLVVDWGLAKPFKPRGDETTLHWASNWPRPKMPPGSHYETCEGEIVGTPAYMSPEQAAGDPDAIGPHSDVYGLGAILYALLTGQSPLGGSASDIVEAVKQGQILSPRQVDPHVPRSLAAVCQKAMAHQPRDRYQTPLDLAVDIERYLADEPVLAYAEPWTDTAFRWMRKHRLSVAVAGVVLLVTSIALTTGYVVVRKERDIAQIERGRAVVANQQAQENAAAVRQVVEEYLVRIGDDRWSNVPGFEGVRVDLANLSVDRYRALLIQQPDDMSLVADAAMAIRRCANLYRMVGSYDVAGNLYDESVGHMKRVVARGQAPKYEQLLCQTLCDRALLVSRVSGPNAAVHSMREALNLSRRLALEQPSSVAAQQTAARVEGDLADLLRGLGQHDEAIRLARSSAVTMQQAASGNPRPLVNRLSAALSSVNLGQTLREAGRSVEAERALDQARERTTAYLQQDTKEPNLRYLEARCLHELALVHIDQRDFENADGEIGQALDSITRLADEFPKVVNYRRKLAEALVCSARIRLARGELDPASEAARRSIDLLEQLDAKRDSGAMPEYLTAAFLVAGEIELKRSDAAAAKSYAARAREAMERALAFNPDSPTLAEDSKRLEAIISALAP
jgi:tRNA A-37 threonylcarbamoyl transferase component Bud32/tetratricopeptide (TPR) repeat protein